MAGRLVVPMVDPTVAPKDDQRVDKTAGQRAVQKVVQWAAQTVVQWAAQTAVLTVVPKADLKDYYLAGPTADQMVAPMAVPMVDLLDNQRVVQKAGR